MRKKKVYGLIFLSFVVFSVILMSVGLVSAQGILDRWKEGALENLDAKILILILVAAIILVILVVIGLNTGLSLLISIPLAFILTAFVTPDAIIGVFKTYEPLPLIIATFIPLLVFFGLTYVAVMKGSRTAMTLQVFAWWAFFFYIIMRILISFAIGWGWVTEWEAVNVPKWGTEQATWFWGATFVQGVIAGIMSIWNGYFMNWAVTLTAGAKDIAALEHVRNIKRGMKVLEDVGNEASR